MPFNNIQQRLQIPLDKNYKGEVKGDDFTLKVACVTICCVYRMGQMSEVLPLNLFAGVNEEFLIYLASCTLI